MILPVKVINIKSVRTEISKSEKLNLCSVGRTGFQKYFDEKLNLCSVGRTGFQKYFDELYLGNINPEIQAKSSVSFTTRYFTVINTKTFQLWGDLDFILGGGEHFYRLQEKHANYIQKKATFLLDFFSCSWRK